MRREGGASPNFHLKGRLPLTFWKKRGGGGQQQNTQFFVTEAQFSDHFRRGLLLLLPRQIPTCAMCISHIDSCDHKNIKCMIFLIPKKTYGK